jgi:autotransporter passenger strand-loop-strand repeat protein
MATITVSNGEIATVPVGQTDTGDIVQSGGTLDVFGSTSGTNVNSGGIILVATTGTVTNGFEIINGGGFASNTTISSGGETIINWWPAAAPPLAP